INELCGKLTPAAQTDDVNVRYAISGLTKYFQEYFENPGRHDYAQILLGALDAAENTEVKTFLLEQLQFVGTQESVLPISRYLLDDDLCKPAARALYEIRTPDASASLLLALSQAKDELKPTLIKTLGDLQSRAAALAILPYAESDDLTTRLMAYYALANIGDPSASISLQSALTKTSGYERAQAIQAYLLYAKRLAEIEAEEKALTIYQSLLSTYTSADDVAIQNAALSGIAAIEGPDVLDMLLGAMDSPYKSHRDMALALAQKITDRKATWAWIEKSKSVPADAQAQIIAFLGARGDTIALPTLLNALHAPSKEVQLEAIESSFRLGGLECVPYFFNFLYGDDGDHIAAVKAAFLQIPGDYLFSTIGYILHTVSAPAKVALLDVIAQRKGEQCYDKALALAKGDDESVRLAAINAIGAIATPDKLNDIVGLLDGASDPASGALEKALLSAVGDLNKREKVEALCASFASAAEKDQAHLLNVLTKIRGEEALKAAGKFLSDSALQKDAAAAVITIVAPINGEGFGLHTNEAYALLQSAMEKTDDASLLETAKKCLPAPLPEADDEGFVSLFNGNDLSGWIWNNSWKDSDSGYYAKEGMIVCDPGKGGNIYTDREFSDFVFKFEFKLHPETNNGLGIRAPLYGDAAYAGMEIQILDHDHPSYNWIKPYQAHGSVYGVAAAERGFLKPVGEWNQETVIVKGRTVKVILNGHTITDVHLDVARAPKTLDGHDHPGLTRTTGHIGFLGHGHPIEFRNLKVKDLAQDLPDNTPPDGFEALFNGRDLTNWKGLVANPVKRAEMSDTELAEAQQKANQRIKQHWNVVDGVIVFDGKGQSLCTEKDYGDFEMYVDWKIKEKGDSGIYLRGSPQVQIWDTKNFNMGSGGLYNNQKNPSKPLVNADYPIGEWNSFHIIMVGERVTVYLNGELVVDNTVLENYWERDKPIYPTGQIELQNHGNTLYFKNIYIREL
ncbi:DUF1080 domain-containing protein, partial [bacterium]|nr:DUF1080 domain-containing protein [bacterium]